MKKHRVFAIGDLHLDHTGDKTMEVFGKTWQDYEQRIFTNWRSLVNDDDLVLIPGDISWALRLREAEADLQRIDALPGTKLLLRGNHDYWWQSRSKIEALGLQRTHMLQNDCFEWQHVAVYGTRGWMARESAEFTEADEKIYQRELQRLALSFSHDSDRPLRVAMIHYPPYNFRKEPNEFFALMKQHDVGICVYGHLHGQGHAQIREGNVDGIRLMCVSADYTGFTPRLLTEETDENCHC